MGNQSYSLKHVVVKLLLPEEEIIKAFEPQGFGYAFNCIAITQTGSLYRFDLNSGIPTKIMSIENGQLDWNEPISLHVSKDQRIAAIANTYGLNGVVVDLEQGSILLELVRGDYHREQCKFPIAFFEREDQTFLIHGTDWNRLDITNPRTREVITDRVVPVYVNDKTDPRYLDYFHSDIHISPVQKWVIDNGWEWHPLGHITLWSIDQWLQNVWESEEGESKRTLWSGMSEWNNPLCWLNKSTVLVLGMNEFDEDNDRGFGLEVYVNTVRFFDVESGEETKRLNGPKGQLVYDELLYAYSIDEGFTAWNTGSGEKVLHKSDFCPTVYHPSAKRFLTLLTHNSFQITEVYS